MKKMIVVAFLVLCGYLLANWITSTRQQAKQATSAPPESSAQSSISTVPHKIKTDTLGESLSTFKMHHPTWCDSINTIKLGATIGCVPSGKVFSYAGVDGYFDAAEFFHDQLYQVQLTFSHDRDYDTLKQRLIQKFGPPQTHKGYVLQNAMNAKWSDNEYMWLGAASSMELRERDKDNVSSTLLIFWDRKLAAAIKAADEKAASAKAANDF